MTNNNAMKQDTIDNRVLSKWGCIFWNSTESPENKKSISKMLPWMRHRVSDFNALHASLTFRSLHRFALLILKNSKSKNLQTASPFREISIGFPVVSSWKSPGLFLGYGISVGQNMAWGQTSWNDAIQDWFDEVKDFGFGVGSVNGKAVGHYTQVNIVKFQ